MVAVFAVNYSFENIIIANTKSTVVHIISRGCMPVETVARGGGLQFKHIPSVHPSLLYLMCHVSHKTHSEIAVKPSKRHYLLLLRFTS